MPELPEVETVVRDLRPLLVGRVVQGVRVGRQRLRHPWKRSWNARLAGAAVTAINRRGKWIIVMLTSASLTSQRHGAKGDGLALLVHLGMTGQLTVAPAASPPADHTHLVFALDNGSELRFRDIRRFGSARLFDSVAALDAFFAARLGPEPFNLAADDFRSAVRRSARSLKALLLDQTVIAGVGNIYADEACFRAGLHPGRRGSSLSDAEADRLRNAIAAVLTQAIAGRGSTIRNYVGGSGLRGTYQGEFAVYGRTGDPCPQCAAAIECVRLAGRSSHYCPRCQPSAIGPQAGGGGLPVRRVCQSDRLTPES
jgi:formamidopyrimidine-DNA glycosylase